MAKKYETRTDMMNAMRPMFEKLTAELGIDWNDKVQVRRFVRSVNHLTAQNVLPLGMPPAFYVGQCVEAAGKEFMKFRQNLEQTADKGEAQIVSLFGQKDPGEA